MPASPGANGATNPAVPLDGSSSSSSLPAPRAGSNGGNGASGGGPFLERGPSASGTFHHAAETVLGHGALLPFIHYTPRPLKRAEEVVYAEQGLLGSGRIFGEGTARVPGDTHRPRRPTSALADTQVELLVLQRAEIEAKLGGIVSFFWGAAPPGPAPGTNTGERQVSGMGAVHVHGPNEAASEAAKKALQKSMAWELYKKRLVQDVFVAKQAKAVRGSLPSLRGY